MPQPTIKYGKSNTIQPSNTEYPHDLYLTSTTGKSSTIFLDGAGIDGPCHLLQHYSDSTTKFPLSSLVNLGGHPSIDEQLHEPRLGEQYTTPRSTKLDC